ncbi:FAD-dependent oxidoreductase [bacterium]|nr:FAD-dependent oxidoreductase [candidate division CSSED10-310 bacterium]
MNKYIPPDGWSTHSRDLNYIRTNIPCQWACPAFTNIPGYIEAVFHGDFDRAYLINRRSNLFPGVLGRICTRPCESACRHGESDLGQPVSICHIKRIAADNTSDDHLILEQLFSPSGKTVGIVGAGPAGLAAAHSLALFGHRVTVYESFEMPGGMLYYGIPAFRLPRAVISEEVFNALRQGIELRTGVTLGKDIYLPDLMAKHDAVILAAGCQDARSLNVPGEDLPGVISGLDFMMQVNRGHRDCVGRRVMVIGGGFTAVDCSRSARRLGAEEVYIAIRGVEEDLTVPVDEIRDMYREGIRFVSLVSALSIDGVDHVSGIRFVRNRFGGIRGSGGRCILPIEGSEFSMDIDTVIAAIGQVPQSGLSEWSEQSVSYNPDSGRSSVPGLYGAGDYIRKASTVIEAIGNGRRVAENVDEDLMRRRRRLQVVSIESTGNTHRERTWDFIERHDMPTIDFDDRLRNQDAEVETGYSIQTGTEAASRCYLCNLKYEIHIPECIYCRWCIDVCPRNCIDLTETLNEDLPAPVHSGSVTAQWSRTAGVVIDSDRCIRCGECYRVCPMQCIHVTRVELQDHCVSREIP